MKQKQFIKSANQIGFELNREREAKESKYLRMGFPNVKEHFAFPKGYPILIGGFDGHGKTEFLIEYANQLSELHGARHVVLTGEMGTVQEVHTKFMESHIRQTIRKRDYYGKEQAHASDEDFKRAIVWMENHYLIIDKNELPENLTFDKLIAAVNAELETRHFSNVSTIIIDPFYEIEKENKPSTEQQIQLLQDKMYLYGQKTGISIIVTNHIAKQDKFRYKDNGLRYVDVPNKYMYSGGQMWPRKGFTIYTVYRPHHEVDYGYKNKEGEHVAIYPEENETWVFLEKAKPEGPVKQGKFSLYLDKKKKRFYEYGSGSFGQDEKIYSHKWWEDEAVKSDNPMADFLEGEGDGSPF